MVIAAIIGCILSFLSGAFVVYRCTLHRSEHTLREQEFEPAFPAQWMELLNYQGEKNDL